jgi:hypothetical protein
MERRRRGVNPFELLWRASKLVRIRTDHRRIGRPLWRRVDRELIVKVIDPVDNIAKFQACGEFYAARP